MDDLRHKKFVSISSESTKQLEYLAAKYKIDQEIVVRRAIEYLYILDQCHFPTGLDKIKRES